MFKTSLLQQIKFFFETVFLSACWFSSLEKQAMNDDCSLSFSIGWWCFAVLSFTGNKRLESSFKESRSTTTRTTSSKSNFGDGMSGLEPGGEYRTELKQWMDNLDSPLVSNHQDIAGQDGKCLRLRFDVSEYRPEEISVKTVNSHYLKHTRQTFILKSETTIWKNTHKHQRNLSQFPWNQKFQSQEKYERPLHSVLSSDVTTFQWFKRKNLTWFFTLFVMNLPATC